MAIDLQQSEEAGLPDAQKILHTAAPELTLAIPLEQHSDLLIREGAVDLGRSILQCDRMNLL